MTSTETAQRKLSSIRSRLLKLGLVTPATENSIDPAAAPVLQGSA